jgi:hypothetical protein
MLSQEKIAPLQLCEVLLHDMIQPPIAFVVSHRIGKGIKEGLVT